MENHKIEFNLNVRLSLGENTLKFLRQVLKLKEEESGIADATSNLRKSASTLQKAVDRDK